MTAQPLTTTGAEILAEIGNFTGTEQWTHHGLRRSILMTDGVIWLAEKAGAHWLMDIIVSYPRSSCIWRTA